MPTALPGSLHPSNSSAISCRNGLVAYGSHCTLVIIDMVSKRVMQTLEKHNAAINLVSWSPTGEFLYGNEFILRCASVDISGVIVIWDIIEGFIISNFCHKKDVPLSIEWLEWEDTNRDFLIALHSSNVFILWNTATGESVWNLTYNYALSLFTVDSFNANNVAFGVSDGCLLLVTDVLLHKAPSGSGSCLSVLSSFSKFEQIQYHSAYPNILFAASRNELVCVEMECLCVIWRNFNDLQIYQFFCCCERDAIWVIHSNGSVHLRVCRVARDSRGNTHLKYECVLNCETQRQSTHHRIYGISFCPVTQSTLALLYNSGRIALYQLVLADDECFKPYRSRYITDFISINQDLEPFISGTLRLSNIAEVFSLGQSACTVRMRPIDGNHDEDLHLAAVGNNQGVLYIVNVFKATIEKEYYVHSCPIKCIDWGGPFSVISVAYSNPLSTSSLVRNDIFVTDIRTGESKRLRPEIEETPVEMLRVSFYHCYLAIGFRSEPLEIWHLKSMRLLRRMSRSCPIITDMAWSGKHNTVRKLVSGSDPVFRENLVVLDQDCHLYHVVVKGLHVRDGKEVHSQLKGGILSLKCLVWKDDYLAMGDGFGRLRVWDLANRHCRQTNGLSRGPILRMTFSRISGDHSLAALHSQCVAIWDCDRLNVVQVLAIGCSVTFMDMDLCGVCPIVLCSDNSFRYIPSSSVNLPVQAQDLPLLVKATMNESYHSESCEMSDILDILNQFGGKIYHGCESVEVQEEDVELLRSDYSLSSYRAFQRLLGNKWLYNLLSVIDSKLIDVELPPHLIMFWSDSKLRRRTELLLSCLMNADDLSQKQVDILVHKAIVISKRDWAMQMLLNSREDNRMNAIRACLLASDVSSEGAQSIIKLVATDLIANNCVIDVTSRSLCLLDKLSDGVQLLFLIGHNKDACRYLQSQGWWNMSVCFAKMVMSDYADVLNRWLENLSAKNTHRVLCYLLLASLGEWDRLLESLMGSSHCKIAMKISTFLQAAMVKPSASTLQLIQSGIQKLT